MGWNITGDLESYVAGAGEFLRANPAENTVPLGLIEMLRAQGEDAFGDGPVFGWWRSGTDGVRGACLQAGSYPLLLSAMPEEAAAELAGVLADRSLHGVNGDAPAARAFATAWEHHTGTAPEVRMRQRLYRLEELEMPDPLPSGTARAGIAADRDLVRTWFTAFERESMGPAVSVSSAMADDRLGYGGIALWELDGTPVSMAGRTRIVSGMARIGPVYTPPGQRRRGYGAAITAVLTASALEAGATVVVLFTDLANPTSNRVYQRIGYRAVSDRLILAFGG
jgi:RimJ/RimL family protein N-acetyltransferase